MSGRMLRQDVDRQQALRFTGKLSSSRKLQSEWEREEGQHSQRSEGASKRVEEKYRKWGKIVGKVSGEGRAAVPMADVLCVVGFV